MRSFSRQVSSSWRATSESVIGSPVETAFAPRPSIRRAGRERLLDRIESDAEDVARDAVERRAVALEVDRAVDVRRRLAGPERERRARGPQLEAGARLASVLEPP